MRTTSIGPVTAALLVGACHPCPDGVLHGSLFIDNSEISSDDGWGTLDDTPVAECREISGSLVISGRISTLRPFDGLERIGGTLLFRNAYGIEDIDGFEELRAAGGLEFNEIERETLTGDQLAPGEQRVLAISGLNSLVEIPGDLTLEHTDIRSVTGLQSLERIGGSAWLWFSPLTGLEGLSNMQAIGGSLYARGTGADLQVLSRLRTIGRNLDTLGIDVEGTLGLSALETIGGDAYVIDVRGLQTVGMPALETVGGELFLTSLSELEHLDGLGSLRQVDGDLRVAGNRTLSSDEVRAWAETLDVTGDIIICSNRPPDVDCNDLTAP